MLKTLARLLAIGAIAAPLAANAVVYQFNATLNQANEVFKPVVFTPSAAAGVASLHYDDAGTVSLLDDTYDFTLAVTGLTGTAGSFHIHAAATTTENAGVITNLNSSPFLSLAGPTSLLVGGINVPVPTLGLIGATAPSAVNAGHPAMSFLDALKGSLAYVNVHTALNGSGEVRGQLFQVAVVPEPETYAMLLAGLGLIGWIGARRRNRT